MKDQYILNRIATCLPRWLSRRLLDIFSYISQSSEIRNMLTAYLPYSNIRRQLFNFSFLERTGNRGWGFAPQSMTFLTDLVREVRPKLIIDCGTGKGNSLAAELCGVLSNGLGKVISLDHQIKFVAEAKKKFASYNKWISIKYIPLRSDNSYNFTPDSLIDLLVVDGPPGYLKNGRLNTMRHLIPYLSSQGVIVLDDIERKEEQKAVESVCREFSLFSEILNIGRQIDIMRHR